MIIRLIFACTVVIVSASTTFALQQKYKDAVDSRANLYSAEQGSDKTTVNSSKGNLWKVYVKIGDHVYPLQRKKGTDTWFLRDNPVSAGSERYLLTERADKLVDLDASNNLTMNLNGKIINMVIDTRTHEVTQNVLSSGEGATASGSSGGGVDTHQQDTDPVAGGGHTGSVALCQLQGSCGGATTSSGSSSSSGGVAGSSSGSSGSTSGSSSGGFAGSSSGSSGGSFSSACDVGGSQNTVVSNIDAFAAALKNAQCGTTVVLAPGNYNGNVSVKKNCAMSNPLVIKAENPAVTGTRANLSKTASGLSVMNNTLEVEGSGIVVDGFAFRNSGEALNMKGSDMAACRNHFFQHTMAGITPYVDGLIGEQNYFENWEGSERSDFGTLRMDYGYRVYDGTYTLRYNVFNGLFHHAISFKENASGVVTDNDFRECGRWCIELGQNPDRIFENINEENTSRTLTVSNNRFVGGANNGSQGMGISIKNVHEAVIEGNTFQGMKTTIVQIPDHKVGSIGRAGASNGKIVYFQQKPPLHPKTTILRNNDFGSGNRFTFQGRGVAGESVLLEGNKGSANCSLKEFKAANDDWVKWDTITSKAPPTLIKKDNVCN